MNNKLKRIVRWTPILLAVSMFVGLAIIAAGGGALFPGIYKIAGPIVCDGRMTVESQSYSYKPGQRGVEHTLYCEGADGTSKEDLGIMPVFVAGFIYGLFVYILLVILMIVWRKNPDSLQQGRIVDATFPNPDGAGHSPIALRLMELESLRQSNLITDAEYQKRRNDLINTI